MELLTGMTDVGRPGRKARRVRLHGGNAIYAVLMLLVLIAAVGTDAFLRPINLGNVTRQAVALGLVSLGQMAVMLTGGVDLSAGAMVSISSVLAAGLMVGRSGMILPALLAVAGAALVTGSLSGLIVTKLRVPPFITTLGITSAVQGATFLYTRKPVGPVAKPLLQAADLSLGPLPLAAVLFVLIAGAFAWVLRYTALGRYLYAIGGHEEAAVLAGIPVPQVKVAAYVLSSLFAAAAGIWLASRMSIGDPNVGSGLELDSITAALIGGSSLAGGVGTVPGTVAGVLVLAVLNNMMNLFGISPFAQQVVKGLIILAAVTVYRSRSRSR